MKTINFYSSAWGCFEIPLDIYVRWLKCKERRPDYLDHWCRFQHQKAMWVAA